MPRNRYTRRVNKLAEAQLNKQRWELERIARELKHSLEVHFGLSFSDEEKNQRRVRRENNRKHKPVRGGGTAA